MRWYLPARAGVIILLRCVGRVLITYGNCWFPPPAPPDPPARGPGAGHPERTCPELPPTAVELMLWRQLDRGGSRRRRP
ncbi:hypothetical protein GCM10010519_28950 [Streptomyces lactacystinicus]